MEQHRTRPPNRAVRHEPPPPLPPQAGREGSRRAPRPADPTRTARAAQTNRTNRTDPTGLAGCGERGSGRRMPNPRLTGLGAGLFGGASMLVVGFLDQLLLGASLTVYGVLFLPVCLLTALWVRAADLLSAPVIAPIAFALGLLPVAGGGNGTEERLTGLVTALATQVGWLYGGTLLAALTILTRGLRRAAARRHPANRR
nr:DUF6542 domain-containing protein [Streptomyces sp. 3214.6]